MIEIWFEAHAQTHHNAASMPPEDPGATYWTEEFDGLHNVHDEGALEAALTAAGNRRYCEQAPLTTCAATYTYHLTPAHAFPEGNKGVAAPVAEISLELKGSELRASDDQIVASFLAIAAGQVSRQDVEQWFAPWIVFKLELLAYTPQWYPSEARCAYSA
jgi:death-on-curing protein